MTSQQSHLKPRCLYAEKQSRTYIVNPRNRCMLLSSCIGLPTPRTINLEAWRLEETRAQKNIFIEEKW